MNELEKYRSQIDEIDMQIIKLLAKRFDIVKKVGEYKKAQNMPPLQPLRWQEVLSSRKAFAKKFGIDGEFIQDIWDKIHEYALKLER